MRDVAVALLLDSSTALLNEWPALLTRYVPALLGRLHNSEYTFAVSIVTYSTADYQPSPIVTKRYFNLATLVLKEVKDEPLKLGVGLTGNAGRRGTAALEGYAAVIEMFDLFLKSHTSSRSTPHEKSEKSDSEVQLPLCHILHICATQPDDAKRPLWNATTSMDSLSWASIPEELRKRNINLNLILLKTSRVLSEVHSNAATLPLIRPFFPVQNGHIVLLSSESSWTPLSSKRQNEAVQAAKAPDAKRTRTQTPSATAGATSTPANIPSASTSQVAQQSAVPPQQPLAGQEAVKKMYDGLKTFEASIQKDQMEMQSLLSQNRTAEAEVLKRNVVAKQMSAQRVRAQLVQLQKQALQSAAAGGMGAQLLPLLGAVQNAPQGQASGPSNEPSAPLLQLQQLQLLQQARNQAQQLNAASNSAANVQNMPFNASVAAQMQKLQMKEGIQGLQTQGHAEAQQQPLQLPMFGGIPATQTKPQAQGPLPAPHQQISSWMGIFAFKTPQPAEIQLLLSCEKQNIRPELWPQKLELLFSRVGAFDLPTLRLWIQRHKPAICKAKLVPRMPDTTAEEQQYRLLLRVLSERSAYAYASWLNPRTGSNKPMLCFFPTGDNGGVAAVFPETGVPELPQKVPPASASQVQPNPQQPPPTSAGPFPALPPVVQAQILRYIQQMIPANLPPEQRKVAMRQKLQEVGAKLQAQYQANMANAANANNPITNALHLSQGPPAQQNQSQGGINTFNNLGNLGGMGGMGFNQGGGPFPPSNAPIGVPAPQQGIGSSVPPTSAGSSTGVNMANMNLGALSSMNLAQALAAMQQQQQRQQQMQGGMGAPSSSGSQQGPFMR